MGLHTWFYKEKELYEEYVALNDKLYAYEINEIYLDDIEILQINHRIDEISKINDCRYHDLFRTHKRNSDGTYTNDVIYSKNECFKWLKDNREFVSYKNTVFDSEEEERELKRTSYKVLNKFWNEYPNGVIAFG